MTPSTAGAGCCVILACSCFNKAEHFAPFPWVPVRHQAVHIRQQDLINSHVTATYEITAPPWTRDPAELTVQPPLIKCIRHRLWELVTLAYIHSAPAEVKVTDNNAYLDRLWLSAASQLCPAPLCPYPSPCLAHFSLFTLIVGHGPDSCPSTPPSRRGALDRQAACGASTASTGDQWGKDKWSCLRRLGLWGGSPQISP